ncbi:hypothetical protein [Brachybacterium sp. 107]|uniref:hypothetical protein n=1 Tax=Brachybacterium sp. 107 TaxID=3457736 RepID=UPI0040345E31
MTSNPAATPPDPVATAPDPVATTPQQVVALLRSRPWASQEWARDLVSEFPDRLHGVLAHWGLEVRHVHLAGAGLPVLEVERRSGPVGPRGPSDAPTGCGLQATGSFVVKFGGGGADVAQQARILAAADGHGYVRLVAHDEERDAMLLEKLGPMLPQTVPDPLAQTDVLGGLLLQAWEVPLDVGRPFAPSQKARSLLEIFEGALAADATLPCATGHAVVLDRARTLACRTRRAAGATCRTGPGEGSGLGASRTRDDGHPSGQPRLRRGRRGMAEDGAAHAAVTR